MQVSRAAESAQSWGDSEQLLGWSAWAGSVAACDAFCASVKRSANPSTAGPKRPLGEIGASRMADLRQREP